MIGTTISHYKILEKLGEGGMGVVYKAQDTTLDRLVALKFLPRVSANDVEKSRFLQEARASAVLNHPNICTIHAVEESDDEQFIAMEFVNGPNVRMRINEGQLPPSVAVRIAVGVAEGLETAHKSGIVHRDVKPENIILTHEGVPKIADFGLAFPRQTAQGADSGLFAGTIAYMSPEQINGGTVDHRTDIWSLGVVLFEMLTGRRPFDSEYDQALMYSILHDKHPALPAGLASLQTLIDRCLEKNPTLRFPDASTLIGELQVLAAGLKTVHEKPARSIAVLPFADLSPQKDNKYFSDGLNEEIIANLSKLRTLRVVSRTSMMRYENAEKTTKQIAAELGAQFVLEGSVRKHGSQIRITTQLIDANQDISIWAENYNGTMADVFDIQERVAGRVVKALKIRLTPGERKKLGRRATKNTDAYELYLKGRYFWNKRRMDELQKAIRYFEEAISKDRRFALAWSGLSDAYNFLPIYGNIPRKEIYVKARKAAEKALEIDNGLAEAHTSLGILIMISDWNWSKSEKEFRTAIRLDPDYATAHHWFAQWLCYTGQIDEALAEMELAAKLDPLSPAILRDKGLTLYYARRYDEAIEFARKTLELEPYFTAAHRLLSMAYLAKGMLPDAIRENERWGELLGNPIETAIALALLYAADGKAAEAVNVLANLPPDVASNGNLMRGIGLVYAALGKKDVAFEWFDKCYDHHAESLCSIKVDPKVDTLRSDPRFTSLLKNIGLSK